MRTRYQVLFLAAVILVVLALIAIFTDRRMKQLRFANTTPVQVLENPLEQFTFVGSSKLEAQGGTYSVYFTVSANNITRLELNSSDATWQLISAEDLDSDGNWDNLSFCTTRNLYNPQNSIPDTCDKSNPQLPENQELLVRARMLFPLFPGQ